jgi:hypothetical protein
LGPVRAVLEPGQPFLESPLAEVNSPLELTINANVADVLQKVGWANRVGIYRVEFRVPDSTSPGMASIRFEFGKGALQRGGHSDSRLKSGLLPRFRAASAFMPPTLLRVGFHLTGRPANGAPSLINAGGDIAADFGSSFKHCSRSVKTPTIPRHGRETIARSAYSTISSTFSYGHLPSAILNSFVVLSLSLRLSDLA